MQCKSRNPALAEEHLRLWGAGHTAGRRYRRVPSAKTGSPKQPLGAAGAGDTSSPGPGPAAPASGLGSRRRPPARKGRRVPGLRRRPRDSGPSPGSRRRPASVTPTHTPSHTTARTASQPHAPSRPFSLAPRLRLSHARPAGSLGGGEPRPRGRGADATPGRHGAAHLHVPETRRPLESAGRPAQTPPEVPPLNA